MAELKRKPKKGPYRRVVKVEITTENVNAREKGEVCEMHPVLADRLIASDNAKKTTKALTPTVHIGKILRPVKVEKIEDKTEE